MSMPRLSPLFVVLYGVCAACSGSSTDDDPAADSGILPENTSDSGSGDDNAGNGADENNNDASDAGAEAGGADDAGDDGQEDDAGDDSADDSPGESDDSSDSESASGGDGATEGGGAEPLPSPGCGTSFGSLGGVELTLTVRGQTRDFVFVVPAGYDPNTAYPLVFGMHGLTGTGSLLRLYASLEGETAGQAIHIYPTGIGNQNAWDLSAGGADVEFFDELVEFATTNVCIDQARIFSYGHSYGGYFSNALGCYRGNVLRAIGPVSGGGPQAVCPEPVAAILAHGEDDGTVEFSSGVGSRDAWLATNGCGTATVPLEPNPSSGTNPCVEYQGCDEDHPVVWCVHRGIDHNFPSGGFGGGGVDYGPRAIWNFFERF